MAHIVITGSSGLIGSEAAKFFHEQGHFVIGIDNDMRRSLFGDAASVEMTTNALNDQLNQYQHYSIDIRDHESLDRLFNHYNTQIDLVIHAAAQPSHDWAADNIETDFSINASGTLNLLQATKQHCPDAVFIYLSTNKVYGDRVNQLPFVEHESRYEPSENHPFYAHGINEEFSIDQSKHSLFGVSKLTADLLVQEFGRYFGMKTHALRCGCLTGPNHKGVELHGFLAYMMQCAITKKPYRIFGYKAKQVRDNIHSYDLVNMIWHIYQDPGCGEVYNLGGGRYLNCSLIEAMQKCETITGNVMQNAYIDQPRIGDHQWWISDISKFQARYPNWKMRYDFQKLMEDLYAGIRA